MGILFAIILQRPVFCNFNRGCVKMGSFQNHNEQNKNCIFFFFSFYFYCVPAGLFHCMLLSKCRWEPLLILQSNLVKNKVLTLCFQRSRYPLISKCWLCCIWFFKLFVTQLHCQRTIKMVVSGNGRSYPLFFDIIENILIAPKKGCIENILIAPNK